MTNYVKTTWADRIVEKPLTYTLQNNGDGTTTLIPTEGTITQTGTPITATALNNLENGVANALDLTAGGTTTGDFVAHNLTATGKIYAPEGTGNSGGYSFTGEFGEDTGMFSPSDGVLDFYSNNYLMVEVTNGLALFNGIVSATNQFTAGEGYGATGGYTFRGEIASDTGMFSSGDGNLSLFSNAKEVFYAFGTGNTMVRSYNGFVQLHSPSNGIRFTTTELRIANPNYDGYVTCYASNYVSISSEKYKTNIKELSESGLDIINDHTIKTYHQKTDDEKKKKKLYTGVIAEESNEIILDHDKEGVDIYSMVSVAWKAIQELSDKVKTLEAKIAELEAK